MCKEIIKYFLLVLLIFGLLTCVLFYYEENYQINWLALAGSVLSVTYVLSIRNPFNYLAFILGAVSTVFLIFVLWSDDLDGALTYLCVFLPAQIYSFFVWRGYARMAAREQGWSLAAPRWQSSRERLLTLGAGVVLMLFSGYIAHLINPDYGVVALFFNALFTTSAVLANLLLIYKLTESCIFWVVFSIAGTGLSLSLGQGSLYLVLMFILYTIVNTMMLVNWIKATRK